MTLTEQVHKMQIVHDNWPGLVNDSGCEGYFTLIVCNTQAIIAISVKGRLAKLGCKYANVSTEVVLDDGIQLLLNF